MYNEQLRLRHITGRPGGTPLAEEDQETLLVTGKYLSGANIP